MKRNRTGFLFVILMVALLLIISCKEAPLKSDWSTARIAGDNPDTAWVYTPTYAWEDQNILIGIQNNADRLIVLLRARNRATQATMMRAGLTIWIDPSGKESKTFGVHYPIGTRDTSAQVAPETQNERADGFGPQTTPMPDTMEIIIGGKDIRVPIRNDLGISVAASNSYGTVTYLLSVPMKASGDFKYAVDASPGSTISLGFETGALGSAGENRSAERDDMMGESDSSFGRSPGEWSDRQMTPPRRPHYGRRLSPVNYWTQVVLATEPSRNGR